jgi:hypothetical protein
MFGRKTLNSTAVVSATSLSNEIDNITKTFTTMVENLKQKASAALQLKAEKEEHIAALQKECDDLQAVNDRATGMADRISGIFN